MNKNMKLMNYNQFLQLYLISSNNNANKMANWITIVKPRSVLNVEFSCVFQQDVSVLKYNCIYDNDTIFLHEWTIYVSLH